MNEQNLYVPTYSPPVASGVIRDYVPPIGSSHLSLEFTVEMEYFFSIIFRISGFTHGRLSLFLLVLCGDEFLNSDL